MSCVETARASHTYVCLATRVTHARGGLWRCNCVVFWCSHKRIILFFIICAEEAGEIESNPS